ncbi:MAG: glycosyltransferase [Butyrivibrio sp.]|nr:glycosyltransferase [Butyrivibrio sp.]
MDAKVSVIVPIYNVKRYLEECLESIKNQSLDRYEVILVDDGSVDGSDGIIKRYCQSNNNWKSIRQRNSGYGKAVNVGIDSAKSSYISIVEPDDYIEKDTLKCLWECAEKNRADVVSADYRWFYEVDGKKYFEKKSVFDDGGMYGRIINPFKDKDVIMARFINPASLFRKTFLEKNDIKHNETAGAAFQDRGFFFLTTMCAERIVVLDRTFYNYRHDNPNSSIAGRNDIDKVLGEYEYIYEQITHRGKMYRRFLPEHFRRELGSCLYALSRAGEQYQKESVNKISDAFCNYENEGLIDKSAIRGHLLEQLNAIMYSPDKVYESLSGMKQEIHNKVKPFERFVIYGAGVVARRIFDMLDNDDARKLLGFAVSDVNNQMFKEYRGCPIMNIEHYLEKKGDVGVIVGVTHRWRKELVDKLDSLGFRHVIVIDSMGADI